MMENATKISKEEFLNQIDLSKLLEENENIDEFMADDPTSYFAKSILGNEIVYFIGTNGFEFIFRRKK